MNRPTDDDMGYSPSKQNTDTDAMSPVEVRVQQPSNFKPKAERNRVAKNKNISRNPSSSYTISPFRK